MEILEDHGVNTVEHHIFHDFDAGIRHVQENPPRTSSNRSARSKTSSGSSTSATRTTAATSSTC